MEITLKGTINNKKLVITNEKNEKNETYLIIYDDSNSVIKVDTNELLAAMEAIRSLQQNNK